MKTIGHPRGVSSNAPSLEPQGTHRVGAVLIFEPGVDIERVRKWMDALKSAGHLSGHDTRTYNDGIGDPVFYIP